MSPNPLRATITDVIRSGMEVPAAKNVSPITCRQKERGACQLPLQCTALHEFTYFGRNLGRLSGDVGPPDHEIGVGRNPGDRSQEGNGVELFAARRFGVGKRQPERDQDGCDQEICEPLLVRAWPGHVQGFRLVFDIVVALQFGLAGIY